MISSPDGSAVLDIPRTDNSILRRSNRTNYNEVAPQETRPKPKKPTLKATMRFDRSELERIMGVPGVPSKVGWLKGLKFVRPDNYFCVSEQLKNGEYEIISCGSIKFESEQLTEKAYSPTLEHDVYVRASSLASSGKVNTKMRAYAAA